MRYQVFRYDGALAQTALFDAGRKEAHVYISSCSTHDIATQIAAVSAAAFDLSAKLGMRPVFRRWLLSDPANQTAMLPKEDCAMSAIGQSPLDGSKCALLLMLEEDADFHEEYDGIWCDGKGRIFVGDNSRATPSDSHSMTTDYLENLSAVLRNRGGSLKDNCLRTWLFVRDIDNNYSGVVRGRNEVFRKEGLTPETHFIASTGIEGKTSVPLQTVAFNAIADTGIKPEQIKYLNGKSHLNPTYEYGVAFERGTAVDYGDRRHVFISGTASIDNHGQIVAAGDITSQTLRMLENIEVLLAEAECEWDDVAHMTVYLRDIADYRTVAAIIESRFPAIPKSIVLAPVCRPGWLVETECMAIKKICNPDHAPF